MAAEYTVLKVTPLSKVIEEGGIGKYYRIKIKTAGGIVDTVDIDESKYTPAKAAPILLAAAKNADAILKL